MKKLLLSVVLCNLFFVGCGNNVNSNIKGGLFEDSPVSGLDYVTNSMGGVTQDGYFKYDSTDSQVVFSLGSFVIGTFNLARMSSDGIVLPADLFDLNRNNTTDDRVIKVIEFLQSLDDDGNIANGITIDTDTKNAISYFVETNDSIKKNLTDNNITVLKYLVEKVKKTWIPERTARDNYKQELIKLGYEPDFMPFTTVWNVEAGDKVTIPVNPNYVYDYTVDWGDGTVSKNVTTTISHFYENGGDYTVKIYNEFPSLYLNNDGKSILSDPDYVGNADKLINVTNWGDVVWKSFYHSFAGAGNLQITANNTPILNQVDNMDSAFADTNLMTFENIGDWNMTNVVNTAAMFANSKFNGFIANWNLSQDTNMSYMFYNDSSFNQPVETWFVWNVKDMSHMFDHASSFNQSLKLWNVSNVKDMSYMFSYASSFNQDISGWNVANVTDMSHMFDNSAAFNQPIGIWNVANVTDMSYMFRGANSFNQDISGWNVANVTDMSHMFESTGTFNQPIGIWNVANVTDMSYMFSNTSSFNQYIGDWNVSNVRNMSYMFNNASSFNQAVYKWDVKNVTDMSHMFDHAASFNQSLLYWDVSNVTDMSYMFSYSIFNQPLTYWNVSNVKNMSHMFYWDIYFNQPLNYWNVSNVTDMSYMFSYAGNFDQNISDWNVSNVTDMNHMFYYANTFDQNISNWNVSNVTDYTDFALYCPIDGTSKMPKFP